MPSPSPRRRAADADALGDALRNAPRRLFCLVDCSNFYCSCERLFRPDLAEVPVAVLSNNDGCVVARSEEVKAMGVPMGAPFFKVRKRLEAEGVVVFSSNYALYADLSRRVMDCLHTFSPDVEVYSIDEAFLSLSVPRVEDRDHRRLIALAEAIRARVWKWTGIPVRVAIAETKTLAKVGSEYAKVLRKRGREPVVSLWGVSAGERDVILRTTAVGDVWGIGRAYERRLRALGVRTAADLRALDDAWVRQHLRVTGLRTVLELRGLSCIPLEDAPPPRKSLVRSRSFSRPVTARGELEEAVATHAARACEKLRAEGLAARAVQVFFNTGHAEVKGPHRSVAVAAELARATNRTPEVLRLCRRLVREAWRERGEAGAAYPYRKAGVLMLDVTRARPEQGHLFAGEILGTDLEADAATDALLEAVDALNRRFGRRTVTFGAEGSGRAATETGQAWAMRRERRSPAYTTRWGELPVFFAR